MTLVEDYNGPLKPLIVVTALAKTCEACPAQWEGETNDGRNIYIRFRWGWLTVLVGSRNRPLTEWEEVFTKAIGPNGWEGNITEYHLRYCLKGRVQLP